MSGEGRGVQERPGGDIASLFFSLLSFQLSGSEVLGTNSSLSFWL